MIRLSLLLAVAGVTGVAAVSAPAAPKTAAAKPVAAKPVAPEAVNASWFVRYGTYNAKTGTMSLIPVRNGEGC